MTNRLLLDKKGASLQIIDASDYIVIGSGAGGLNAAFVLAQSGASVTILEEGFNYSKINFPKNMLGALEHLWRDFGYQHSTGNAILPILEGCCIGGSTTISGAIFHPLPKAILDDWIKNDPSLAKSFEWHKLENILKEIKEELGVTNKLQSFIENSRKLNEVSSPKNTFTGMNRFAPGCIHTGSCLIGCPSGGKNSLENTLLPKFLNLSGKVYSGHKVKFITLEGSKGTGVVAQAFDSNNKSIGKKYFKANKGIIVACGTIQSPLLLKRSGFSNMHIGRNFQLHTGSAVVGEYSRPSVDIEGPAMGLEVFNSEKGYKLSSQTIPTELLFARLPFIGSQLKEKMKLKRNFSAWTSLIKSSGHGKVSSGLWGPSLKFTVTPNDMLSIRSAAHQMAENLFELGAQIIYPQIQGIPNILSKKSDLSLISHGPLNPRAYPLAASHLFGTCKIGSTPFNSVVDPNFLIHGTKNIFVLDASIFPSNLGVNPQASIMAIARLGSQKVLECT